MSSYTVENSIVLDVNRSAVQTIYAKQYDNNTRVIYVEVVDKGNHINITELGYSVYLKAKTSIGTDVLQRCSVDETDIITIELTDIILAAQGHCDCELMLLDHSSGTVFEREDGTLYMDDVDVVSTMPFILHIRAAAFDDIDVNPDEYVTLNEQLALVEQLEEEVTENESFRNANEDIRISNESIRNSNEDTRIANESVRMNNESVRLSNENIRRSNENQRLTNESQRIFNEGIRLDNENIRKANEQERVASESVRNSNELVRISNENLRVSNEDTRYQNEETRTANEVIRIANENSRRASETIREDNELIRINNEVDRNVNETIRISNESLRNSNESCRLSNESVRSSNERQRISNESVRNSNEYIRISNENIRNTDEQERVSNESIRNGNESVRISNENLRVSNENTRYQNEETRTANEVIRIANENARRTSESIRINNENIRISNESIRIANETMRVSTIERINHDFEILEDKIDTVVLKSQLGVPSTASTTGVATLDSQGLVPESQLPSYVDDVLEGTAQNVTQSESGSYSATGFILTGESSQCTPEDGKIYIDTADLIQYRWSGSVFVSVGSHLALGETSSTAFPGDRGKTLEDTVAGLSQTGHIILDSEGNSFTQRSNLQFVNADVADDPVNNATIVTIDTSAYEIAMLNYQRIAEMITFSYHEQSEMIINYAGVFYDNDSETLYLPADKASYDANSETITLITKEELEELDFDE